MMEIITNGMIREQMAKTSQVNYRKAFCATTHHMN